MNVRFIEIMVSGRHFGGAIDFVDWTKNSIAIKIETSVCPRIGLYNVFRVLYIALISSACLYINMKTTKIVSSNVRYLTS